MLDGVPGWTARPDVPDMKGVARTVRERREGIPGYLDGRLADAYLEGANSLTRPVKRAARGFRNVEYLAIASKIVVYERREKKTIACPKMSVRPRND